MLAALRRASAVKGGSRGNDGADGVQPTATAAPDATSAPITAATTSTGSNPATSAGLAESASLQNAYSPLEEVDEDFLELPGAHAAGLQVANYPSRSSGSGLSPPRLFRRLPKRRRIDELNKDALANVVGDTHSITSSSNETNQATLYEEGSANHHSTPATSSSDEGDPALALQEATLVEGTSGNVMKELDGNTVEINMTEFTRACQDGRGTEFLREHGIDLEKRDRQSTVTPTQLPQRNVEQPIEPLQEEEEEEEALDQRMELLSLSDVDMLVRHVAQGNSFFGGAGVTAVAAGLGLYDQNEDIAGLLPGETEKAAEDFAKLALWATLPGAIEAWISAPDRDAMAHPGDAEKRRLSPLASLYDKVVEDEKRELYSEDLSDDYDEREEGDEEAEAAHDAFDANDKERWTTPGGKAQFGRSRKMRYSPASSATLPGFNTKKRKVPSAGMAAIDDSPMTSPKIHKRDEKSFHSNEEPVGASAPDRSSLVTLADEILGVPSTPSRPVVAGPRSANASAVSSQAFKRDADMLARLPDADTLAAYVGGPAINQNFRNGKRIPTSSHRTRRYAEKRRKPSRWPLFSPPLPYDHIDPRDALPPPISAFPAVPQAVLPMTAKRAAKAKKAKSKLPPQPVQPTLKAPILPIFFTSIATTVYNAGDNYAGRAFSWATCQFVCECASGRFQADLRAFQTQKLHLLMLLKAKRREELLRRKLELEEEKLRLTKALNADLKAKYRPPARKPSAALPPSDPAVPAHSAPPSAPLPPPPPLPSTSDLPPTPVHNGKPPPKKGKKKRSAYANANNSHHRQNYVPSRLPASSGGKRADTLEGLDASAGGSLDIPLPHDNDSEVLNFAPDDWMCTFCEYELWYGSKPQLANCVKKRKKLLKVRQKALDRAKGTVEGTNKKKAAPAPAATAQPPLTPGEAPTTPKSAATLPGTIEQQVKAENAKPTRAPPPSPTSNSLPVKGATLPASASAGVAAATSKPTKQASKSASGISNEILLNYHCVANGLPSPIYYYTDMKSVPRAGVTERYFQSCSIKIGKEIYKCGTLSNEIVSLAKVAAKPPAMLADPKEDVAQRVLHHMVSGEKLTWNMSHAVSKEGLVVYRPGEKDFICSLKEASQVYKNASALLEEYTRLDGGPLPAWYIRTAESDPDSGAPETFSVSVALGTQIFDVEDSVDELDAREKAAVKALEWLQRDKNEKFTEMIRQSKVGRAKGIDEEIAELDAAEEDLNDVD